MDSDKKYYFHLKKEAEFWGKMAEVRSKSGIPDTMDYRLATNGRIKRGELGWGDCIQDRELELITPFGKAKKKFLDEFSNFAGKKVLDLGCGAGWLALELAREGLSVYAVDCSLHGMIVARAYQRTLSEDNWRKINWIIGDMNHLPIEVENQFDLVTAWDSIHHVKEIDELMRRVSKALKPGGILMISERIQGGKNTVGLKIGSVIKCTANLCFPMVIRYSSRFENFKGMLLRLFNKVFKRKKKPDKNDSTVVNDDQLVSPFEDICGSEMIESIDKYFSIEKQTSYRAFSDDIERSAYFGRRFDILKKITIFIVSWIDYFLIKLKLLPGQIIFMYCKKK